MLLASQGIPCVYCFVGSRKREVQNLGKSLPGPNFVWTTKKGGVNLFGQPEREFPFSFLKNLLIHSKIIFQEIMFAQFLAVTVRMRFPPSKCLTHLLVSSRYSCVCLGIIPTSSAYFAGSLQGVFDQNVWDSRWHWRSFTSVPYYGNQLWSGSQERRDLHM